jgi:hypothetical protein
MASNGEHRRAHRADDFAVLHPGKAGRWRDGSGVQADDTRLDRQKHMSQGQIEEKTGLLRCYISRIENGHTVPTIETLEKLARAM